MIDYFSEIKEFHKNFVEPYKGKPRGCSETEITRLEDYFGFEFPLAYKQYLEFMGNDEDGVFVGSDCFAKDVISNTEWLPQLLAENEIEFALPEHYLVFFLHQGYTAVWFNLPKDSENPEVWLFSESPNAEALTPRKAGTFIESIFTDLQAMASLLPNFYGNRKQ